MGGGKKKKKKKKGGGKNVPFIPSQISPSQSRHGTKSLRGGPNGLKVDSVGVVCSTLLEPPPPGKTRTQKKQSPPWRAIRATERDQRGGAPLRIIENVKGRFFIFNTLMRF